MFINTHTYAEFFKVDRLIPSQQNCKSLISSFIKRVLNVSPATLWRKERHPAWPLHRQTMVVEQDLLPGCGPTEVTLFRPDMSLFVFLIEFCLPSFSRLLTIYVYIPDITVAKGIFFPRRIKSLRLHVGCHVQDSM